MTMKTMLNIKKAMLLGIMATVGMTAYAHHRLYTHISHRPAVVTVVKTPAAPHISNHLDKKDRLEMALAYLKSHKSLSISKYSKMTGLTKATAEAELDAFVANKSNPIKMVIDGKKKHYVI